MKKLLLPLALLFCITSSFATVRDVPGTYPTIQAALNACVAGDTVLVTPGIYAENITWPSVNGIKLLNNGSSNLTIIDGGNNGRVFNITSSNIDTNTVIRGFSVTGGYLTTSGYGAGFYISNASVILDDVVVDGNRVFVPGGHGYGAGIHLSQSNTIIRKSAINNNTIDSATWCYGGGIYVSGGSPVFDSIQVNGNHMNAENWCYGVGIYVTNNANVTLNKVEVSGNTSGDNAIWYYGTGIYMDDATATLTNVLVSRNVSGAGGSFNYGGGIYFDGITSASLTEVTIAGNSKTGGASINGSGLFARDAQVNVTNSISFNPGSANETGTSGTGGFTIQYSNIRNGFSGNGNLNVNPQFVNNFDFHLTVSSMCAAAGDPAYATATDLDGNPRPVPAGTNPDMGCYEVDQSLTSVSEIAENYIFVYPNPVRSGSNIRVSVGDMSKLKIFDMTGRLIWSEKNDSGVQEITVTTAGWNPGMYTIPVKGNKPLKILVTD